MSNTEGKQNITQNSNTIKFDAVKSEKYSIRTVERSYNIPPKTEILNTTATYQDMRVYSLTVSDVEKTITGDNSYSRLYSADTGLNLLQRQKLKKALLKAMKQ